MPLSDVLEPSRLPYELPDFAAISRLTIDDLRAAFAEAMRRERAEWEAIATDPAPADVANTLVALESAGEALGRVERIFFTLTSLGDDDLQDLAVELAPTLSAHADALLLDRRIFDRLEALHERLTAPAGAHEGPSPETLWLLERHRTDFVRAGVRLGAADQARLRELNAAITTREAEFDQAVTQATAAAAVVVEEAETTGLSQDERAALAENARARGVGGLLLTLGLPTAQPILASVADPGLRERVHAASVARGLGERGPDTRPLVLDLARLRAERARLLGFAHHADYVASDATARTSDAVHTLLAQLAPAARRNADAEAAELETVLKAPPRAADWLHADARRRAAEEFDPAALRPYLELGRVYDHGVFHAAHLLYGLRFVDRPDLAGYHPDVRVVEIFDGPDEDAPALGLLLLDPFARAGKAGGAWMHDVVPATGMHGTRAVVVNNLNIVRPPAGEPTLLTWDEVITAFHEFGHALHSVFTTAYYPSLAGTNVPRDFVEYPSQVNEMWAWHPRIIASYARHHRTGEALPAGWIEKLRAGQREGQGFATTEYLAAAILDQAWHRLSVDDVPTDPADVPAFEARALAEAGIDHPLVPPRYRSAYFKHAFGGGYDAAYYSYIWSEGLDADTVAWFTENETAGDGGLDRAAGDRFRRVVLAPGHSRDPLASYRDLRGRDVDLGPLLARRGLD